MERELPLEAESQAELDEQLGAKVLEAQAQRPVCVGCKGDNLTCQDADEGRWYCSDCNASCYPDLAAYRDSAGQWQSDVAIKPYGPPVAGVSDAYRTLATLQRMRYATAWFQAHQHRWAEAMEVL